MTFINYSHWVILDMSSNSINKSIPGKSKYQRYLDLDQKMSRDLPIWCMHEDPRTNTSVLWEPNVIYPEDWAETIMVTLIF